MYCLFSSKTLLKNLKLFTANCGKITSGTIRKIEESNGKVDEGDGEDRECCSDEIRGDRASTIVELPLLILVYTTQRGRQLSTID